MKKLLFWLLGIATAIGFMFLMYLHFCLFVRMNHREMIITGEVTLSNEEDAMKVRKRFEKDKWLSKIKVVVDMEEQ